MTNQPDPRSLYLQDDPVTKRLHLGGHDISPAITDYTIEGSYNSLPEVTISLRIIDVTLLGHTATWRIDEVQRDLLIRLGWTPPQDQNGPNYTETE